MSSRQTLAKLGVFVLLSLNIGAYWYFWPRNTECCDEVAEPEASEFMPMPAKARKVPVAPAENVAPQEAPAKAETPAEQGEMVRRLLEQIKNDASPEAVAPIPVIVEPSPPAPKPGVPPSPRPGILPPLKAEPLSNDPRQGVDNDVAVASALAPKLSSSAWILETQPFGTQTRLLVKRRPAASAGLPIEFEIHCDRVATHTDGVQAIGNVRVAGAGFKGTCQRVSIPAQGATLLFEGQVRITPTGAASTQLCGERFVWEQPEIGVDVNATEFRPAGLLLPPKGALGPPR